MISGYFRDRAARASRNHGNAARDAGRWREAADAYRVYLAQVSDDFAIRVQLGHMESEAGDAEAAEAAYSAAAKQRPDDSDLLLCWGHSRKKAGDADGARGLYERSAAIDGNSAARVELDRLASEPVPNPEPLMTNPPEQPIEPEPEPEPPHVSGGAIDRVEGLDDALLDHAPLEVVPVAVDPAERPAWEAKMHVVKPFVMPAGGEVALFVTHAPGGAMKPHVLPYLNALREEGIAVLVIAVTDRQISIRAELLDAIDGMLVRDNAGYDFAAWAHAIHLHPEVYGASALYLLNDSVIGPAEGRLGRLMARIRASDADLIGLTESHEYRWHVQTFFLALKPRLLSSFALHRFFANVAILPHKDAVIQRYELHFAQWMEEDGARVEVLFPSPAALNPTLNAWRGLLADDFPFMKLLLLRGVFPDADIAGWRETVSGAGFDLAMIDATLHAGAEEVPGVRLGPLLAHAPLPVDGGQPLKVAFFGPWNYDNGLGSAARGTIAALRRTGVRLNLHPIKKPFHIHRPIGPPVDVAEFDGPADIAIVHLNPDSWFLLTEAQRAAVRAAGKRIGYWVWEMAHIPPAWRHDFSSVDRIWTPSRYCASLFEDQDEAPVDVVPHAVPLPAPRVADRIRLQAELGVPAEGRLILYVFDGSSYLVRKNPAALVRAFAASGLAAKGWTLVLKTKHLMDRPQDGQRFRDLAEGAASVVLIDRALAADELGALSAAADIYASPHCSEGFGLTVAEAMAAGKAVVATDFSGTADYLGAETGYPVKAHEWTLDEDFGHYTKGGTWARIDEPALAAALQRAAADIEAGDFARGKAARDFVGERLSYAAIGDLMRDSFDRLASEVPRWAPVTRIEAGLAAGVPFDQADLGDAMRAVPVRDDGSPRPDGIGVPESLPVDRDHWVAFAPVGSVITPELARIVADHAGKRPDVAIFYGDDLALGTARAVDQLRLKPEFDLTLLAAQDYVGAPLIVRASALAGLGGLDIARGTAGIADLLFRAHAAGLSIARIPEVLLAVRGERVHATTKDYRAMLEAQPALSAYDIVDGASGSFALSRRFTPETCPPLTIIIPTRRTALPDGGGQLCRAIAGRHRPGGLADGAAGRADRRRYRRRTGVGRAQMAVRAAPDRDTARG